MDQFLRKNEQGHLKRGIQMNDEQRAWFDGWPVFVEVDKGGSGSGHAMHAGIPGYQGGSLPGQGGTWAHHGGDKDPIEALQNADHAIRAAKQFEKRWAKQEAGLTAKSDAAWDAWSDHLKNVRRPALDEWIKARTGEDRSRADELRARLDEIDEEMEPLYKRTDAISKEFQAFRQGRREAERQAMGIYVTKPAQFSLNTGRLRKTKNAREGLEAFNKVVSGDAGFESRPVKLVRETSARGGWASGEDTIATNTKVGAWVALHELGHILEHRTPGLRQAAQAFLARRTVGEAPRKLRTVTGIRAYRSDEVAKVDKFMDPYMGKQYEHGSTEIVSMGVQYLWERPAEFASKDPDYFKFIYEAARGRY